MSATCRVFEIQCFTQDTWRVMLAKVQADVFGSAMEHKCRCQHAGNEKWRKEGVTKHWRRSVGDADSGKKERIRSN